MSNLLDLADGIDACVEDAKRPELVPGYDSTFAMPDVRIVILANALATVATALRTIAEKDAAALRARSSL